MPITLVSLDHTSLGEHIKYQGTAKYQLQEPGEHGSWGGKWLSTNPVGRATTSRERS